MIKWKETKLKPADWWDVRDIARSLLKTADESLSDALTEIGSVPELRDKCNFYKYYSYSPIPTPEEFNEIYSINKSMDVYLLMTSLMKKVWTFSVLRKIKGCSIVEISKNPDLLNMLKEALVYSSLKDALDLSQLSFITTGVAYQYEELPWQKSIILGEHEKIRLSDVFSKKSSEALGYLVEYIKENAEEFPCYQSSALKSTRKIIDKKSSLGI